MPITSLADRKGRAAVAKQTLKLEKLETVYVSLNDVHPNSYNPNEQSDYDFELLLRSMEEDGFTQPILVQRETKEIVDGFHRWKAAGILGYTEIPVVFTEMTPEQMKVATLRHNRARGNENVELTAELLRDLQTIGALPHAQDSLMMDDAEVRLLIENVPAPDALAGDDFTPAWEPSRANDTHQTETSQTSLTPQGAETLRRQEQSVSEARTAEDKRQARIDNNVYRLSLIFSGEEADVVKQVLGDQPAIRLLALCSERVMIAAEASAAQAL